MKNIINYILIGFIQGITEFLPVSSSGHIVLFGSFFELDNLLLISVVAHIGTLFALLFCYKNKIKELIFPPKNTHSPAYLFKNKTNINLILATIPTILIVLIFHDFLEKSFSTKTLVWGFLLSAIFLTIADIKKEGNKQINKTKSIYLGLSQGLALLPGISRSGTTLTCALLMGINKEEALDFSFLMSIPIITASAVYESIKLFSCQLSVNWFEIFIVMLSSFIFGILSIKIMLKVVKKNKLYVFSIYLIILSLLVLLFF